jgi:SUMO ligase MMS21 Smc5/6 complex component
MAGYKPVPSIPIINHKLNYTYGKDGILKKKRNKNL